MSPSSANSQSVSHTLFNHRYHADILKFCFALVLGIGPQFTFEKNAMMLFSPSFCLIIPHAFGYRRSTLPSLKMEYVLCRTAHK